MDGEIYKAWKKLKDAVQEPRDIVNHSATHPFTHYSLTLFKLTKLVSHTNHHPNTQNRLVSSRPSSTTMVHSRPHDSGQDVVLSMTEAIKLYGG